MRVFLLLTVVAHLSLFGILAGKPGLTAAILVGYACYHALIAWAIMNPRSRLFGPNRSHLDTPEPVVSLTFDDGPHPDVTPRLLDLLRERGVRGTFFLIGREVERYPELARRIVAEGHVVGNHTATHSPMFWAHSRVRLRHEIEVAQRAIEAAAPTRRGSSGGCAACSARAVSCSCTTAPIAERKATRACSRRCRFSCRRWRRWAMAASR